MSNNLVPDDSVVQHAGNPLLHTLRCRFMSLVHDLIVGTLDASQYEDACRALLGELPLALASHHDTAQVQQW